MDQFEEISKKNKRFLGVTFSFPVFVVIVFISVAIYYAPFLSRLKKAYEIEQQVLAAGDMTYREAEDYLKILEQDQPVMNYMLGNEEYNTALFKLYLKTENYDKIIERYQKATAKKSTTAYDSYVSMAYLEKKPSYRADYDNGVSAFHDRKFDDAAKKLSVFISTPPPSLPGAGPDVIEAYKTENEKLKQDARSILETIEVLRPIDKPIVEKWLDKEKLAVFSDEVDKNPLLLDFTSNNFKYNIMLFDYYMEKEEYEKVITRAELAIKTRDHVIYYYYLGTAYDHLGKTASAIKKMKEFLTKDPDSISGTDFAYERKVANLFLSATYYSQGQYKESLEFLKQVVREEIAAATGSRAEMLKEFGSIVMDRKKYSLASAVDTDRDGMSDDLENYFKTDKKKADTDSDGYKDGNELLNGHNPTKKAPDDVLSDKDYHDIYSGIITY